MQARQYKKEVKQNCIQSFNYWMQHTVDEINGGFFGKIDNQNDVILPHQKVLYSMQEFYGLFLQHIILLPR